MFFKIMDKEGTFYDNVSKIPESKRRYFPETIFPPNEGASEEMHLDRW